MKVFVCRRRRQMDLNLTTLTMLMMTRVTDWEEFSLAQGGRDSSLAFLQFTSYFFFRHSSSFFRFGPLIFYTLFCIFLFSFLFFALNIQSQSLRATFKPKLALFQTLTNCMLHSQAPMSNPQLLSHLVHPVRCTTAAHSPTEPGSAQLFSIDPGLFKFKLIGVMVASRGAMASHFFSFL